MGRSKGDWGKQVWMVFDGKSRPWDIGAEELGEEMRERDVGKENGMAAEGVRLMAEGRMVGWNELAKLVDEAIAHVLGNMRGGMGKKSRKKKEKKPVGIR